MLPLLRRKGFWLKDRLAGSVSEHYLDLSNSLNAEFSLESSFDKLVAILSHATSTVPYYKSFDSNFSDPGLSDFPVIDKSIFKKYFNDMLSANYSADGLHSMSTSGSTGTPFKVLQDKGKRDRVLAELIYFNELAEHYLGERFIFFRVWNDGNRKSKLARFAQNIICIDILELSHSTFENVVNIFSSDKSIKSCLGYASSYEHLCKYIESKKIKFRAPGLRSIITGAEVMPIELKHSISRVLGCSVYDRYSNQENGIIAQSENCSDIFFVNYSSYLVEILKEDSDCPVNVGEVGRIVVTDIYNYAMPMIRYDTGDLAIKIDAGPFAQRLKSIQGRQVDVIYSTNGEVLTPHTWSVYMWKFDQLEQYQFIQESKKEYKLKVAGADGIYSRDDFLEVLIPILGSDAEIDVIYVDRIPVLASGKFKKTICNYQPEKIG